MTTLNERYEALMTRRCELEESIANQRLTDKAIKSALEFASKVAAGIENADDDGKRHIIDLFDAHILIKDGKAFLTHKVQTTPIELHTS